MALRTFFLRFRSSPSDARHYKFSRCTSFCPECAPGLASSKSDRPHCNTGAYSLAGTGKLYPRRAHFGGQPKLLVFHCSVRRPWFNGMEPHRSNICKVYIEKCSQSVSNMFSNSIFVDNLPNSEIRLLRAAKTQATVERQTWLE